MELELLEELWWRLKDIDDSLFELKLKLTELGFDDLSLYIEYARRSINSARLEVSFMKRKKRAI